MSGAPPLQPMFNNLFIPCSLFSYLLTTSIDLQDALRGSFLHVPSCGQAAWPNAKFESDHTSANSMRPPTVLLCAISSQFAAHIDKEMDTPSWMHPVGSFIGLISLLGASRG